MVPCFTWFFTSCWRGYHYKCSNAPTLMRKPGVSLNTRGLNVKCTAWDGERDPTWQPAGTAQIEDRGAEPKTKPDSQGERSHQQKQQKSTSIDMYDIIMHSNDGRMHAQWYAMDRGGGLSWLILTKPAPPFIIPCNGTPSLCLRKPQQLWEESLKATTRIDLMSQDENSWL